MRSIQVELDQFFAHIALPPGRLAQDDAFRMARKKLHWQALVELNAVVLSDLPPSRADWHGFRVVAGDGTSLRLPCHHPDVRQPAPDGFDFYHAKDGGGYSLARAAALCDAASGLILHADLAADTVDERTLLAAQLQHLRVDDLLVLDRGYPAYWLFALLRKRQRHFCIRLPIDFSKQVKAFVASGERSRVVQIQPGTAHRADFDRHGLARDAFPLRLVRVPLKSGEIEILATSLLDESIYPSAGFAALYQKRWRIEEAFRHIKNRLHVEQFGGETPLAIRQEFHATILLHNLATLAAQDALAPHGAHTPLRANLTHASHLIRQHLPRLLFDPDARTRLCAALLDAMSRQLTRRRPDRPGPPRKPSRQKPHPKRAYK